MKSLKEMSLPRAIGYLILMLFGFFSLMLGYGDVTDCHKTSESFSGEQYKIVQCNSTYGYTQELFDFYVYSHDGSLLAKRNIVVSGGSIPSIDIRSDGDNVILYDIDDKAYEITLYDIDEKTYKIKMPPSWIEWVYARLPSYNAFIPGTILKFIWGIIALSFAVKWLKKKFKNSSTLKVTVYLLAVLLGIRGLALGYTKPAPCKAKEHKTFLEKQYTIEECRESYNDKDYGLIYIYSDSGNLLVKQNHEINGSAIIEAATITIGSSDVENLNKSFEAADSYVPTPYISYKSDKIILQDINHKEFVIKMPPTWLDWLHARLPLYNPLLMGILMSPLLIICLLTGIKWLWRRRSRTTKNGLN